MKPKFEIIANGKSITALVSPILHSLTVTDETSEKADTFSLVLDDSAGTLEFPKQGALVSIKLGLGSLVDLGTFTVATVRSSGPPSLLQIDGHAAPFSASGERNGMQARKSRSFDEKTIGDIVKQIAGEHGLDPVIAKDLEDADLGHLDQTDESDASFLNRVAREVGAVVKATSDRLAFVKRGTSETASGKNLPTITLLRKDVTTWDFTAEDRGNYKSVVATYRDHGAAQTVEVVVGDGEPSLRLPHTYSSSGNAKRAATAKLDDSKRSSGGTFQLTMPARLDIIAESPLSVAGIRQGVDGSFIARRVTHTLDGSGLRTTVDAEKPKKEGEADGD
jgi:phage protein D